MIIAAIAYIISIACAFLSGFGFGKVHNKEDWAPGPKYNGTEIKGFYDSWDDFQDRKRSEKVDILTVLDWEEEIKANHIN